MTAIHSEGQTSASDNLWCSSSIYKASPSFLEILSQVSLPPPLPWSGRLINLYWSASYVTIFVPHSHLSPFHWPQLLGMLGLTDKKGSHHRVFSSRLWRLTPILFPRGPMLVLPVFLVWVLMCLLPLYLSDVTYHSPWTSCALLTRSESSSGKTWQYWLDETLSLFEHLYFQWYVCRMNIYVCFWNWKLYSLSQRL